MKPTQKSEEVENLLTAISGNDRRESITANRCIPAPMGCGRVITDKELQEWDQLTFREYSISGWCKECQDGVFFLDGLEPDVDFPETRDWV